MTERIYKPGYVEKELMRIARDPHLLNPDDLRHVMGMMAATMLILLEQTATGKEGGK